MPPNDTRSKAKIVLRSFFVYGLLSLFVILIFSILLGVFSIPYSDIAKISEGKVVLVTGPRSDTGDEFDYKFVSENPEWVRYAEIPRHIKGAVIVGEDWDFYHHSGVDLRELYNALGELVKGERFRGASTITQQLVKNLFLDHGQSFLRKAREILIALYMETKVSKSQILEYYLNVAHLGKKPKMEEAESDGEENFYGLVEAANFYFGKTVWELRPREAAFLAMLLPAPNRYSQSFQDRELTPFARDRIARLLHLMRVAGFISLEEYELSKEEFFSWEKREQELYSLPSHFSDHVFLDRSERFRLLDEEIDFTTPFQDDEDLQDDIQKFKNKSSPL